MKYTLPLILVQFLKSSTLEAFTAMALVKAPTPMPSQAGDGKALSGRPIKMGETLSKHSLRSQHRWFTYSRSRAFMDQNRFLSLSS